MQFLTIFRVVGVLLMIFSLSMVPPVLIDCWYKDGAWLPFLIVFLVTFTTGLFCWFCCRQAKTELKTRDGFVIVVLFWLVLSLFGALPFMIAEHPHLSFVNAAFEAVSGLTTTGATVLSGIDQLPHAILYYRQQLQFLGGMGIIVLAIAILPMLGIGGMQLYRAENTSLAKDTKLTPRLTQTAKALWYIYLGLTILCIFAYWAAGMQLFDAVCESFSTVSSGGFSTHDTSFAFYHNDVINWIAIIFMLLGTTNFSLHYHALQRMTFSYYWHDVEFKAMITVFLGAAVLIMMGLLIHRIYPTVGGSIEQAFFMAVSAGTSTGFTVGDFHRWPSFLPILVMLLGIIGASAASTSGGLKIVRLVLLVKQGLREIKRLIHPQAVIPIKLGSLVVENDLLQAVWGFIGMLIALYIFIIFILMACGLDFESAFANAVCALGNVGISLGQNQSDFSSLNQFGKWTMVFGMLAGRLEIFTLLVLLTPAFWRR